LNRYNSRFIHSKEQKGEGQIMLRNTTDNNSVLLIGKVGSAVNFSHEVYGEGFYIFKLVVSRLSGYNDVLPVTVSERLIADIDLSIGAEVQVYGQFRSYNKTEDGSNRLILTVFTRELSNIADEIKNPNQIFINGYICKPPIYRITPFKREITDLLLAVNRAYNKSDYIPVIAWGRNARFCQNLEVGTNIKIWGRIQSRIYQKRYPNGETVEKTAYEVSVSNLEVVRLDSDNN
jgi:hypothetical protein